MSEQEQDITNNPEPEIIQDDDLDPEVGAQDPDPENPEVTEGFDVVIDGEEPPKQDDDPYRGQPAPEWVKELRVRDKENQKRIKELESELSIHRKPQEIQLGEKPTLESAGYDTDEFERQLTDWHNKKIQFDQQEQAKKAEQEKVVQQWQERVKSYETKKTAIKAKVHDYDEAEEIARDALNQTQLGILISGAENPELLTYHLGKNPAKAKELAAIQDPIQFAFKLAKIDAQVKVQQRKPTTSPEKKVEGSAPLSGIVDAKEAELEKKALKTGDRTELIQYRKSKKGK